MVRAMSTSERVPASSRTNTVRASSGLLPDSSHWVRRRSNVSAGIDSESASQALADTAEPRTVHPACSHACRAYWREYVLPAPATPIAHIAWRGVPQNWRTMSACSLVIVDARIACSIWMVEHTPTLVGVVSRIHARTRRWRRNAVSVVNVGGSPMVDTTVPSLRRIPSPERSAVRSSSTHWRDAKNRSAWRSISSGAITTSWRCPSDRGVHHRLICWISSTRVNTVFDWHNPSGPSSHACNRICMLWSRRSWTVWSCPKHDAIASAVRPVSVAWSRHPPTSSARVVGTFSLRVANAAASRSAAVAGSNSSATASAISADRFENTRNVSGGTPSISHAPDGACTQRIPRRRVSSYRIRALASAAAAGAWV